MTSHAPSAAAPLQVTVITPHRGWFDWRLRQLWNYRDLIRLFVWRDFVSVYKQTVLGPIWHVVRPLITTLTFTVVFGRVTRLSTDGAPPFLFYMVGNVVWTYFANCIENTSRTFVSNAGIFGKVYFHRLVIPLSLVMSNLVAFGIQIAILVLAMLGYVIAGTPVHVTSWLLMTPFLTLVLAGYALGGGIIVSALTTRYRDLSYLVTFGIQLVMYLSPVIYPVSSIPPRYQWTMALNPLAVLFEGFRLAFLGVGTVSPLLLGGSTVGMLVLLTIGLILFTRVERTFMDTV